MSNYYKLRKTLMVEVKDYLFRLQDKKGEPLREFQKNMAIKYGVTDKLLGSCFEKYGIRVTEDNQLEKIEE